MSKQIDERVVSMQFDNANFEKNVSTSISTLDKLKNSLKLDGMAKGLDNVEAAAKKCDFSPLANGVETVKAKFSALQVAGFTAIQNLTNTAISAGKRIVKALTVDPIMSGFREYETQINSVQTILANTESKGSTLQDVNSALAELNTYADKTIYNFTEMTRNIGTFTAAGVDLKTSVSAIKGIANLAAVSGSTSQQASTAMYQLSQALSSGTVKLQDWNSVVNAGMGGQVFQDALKETARVHGVKIDEMIKKEGSFRETLKSGWLTSKILTETLSKFTGDLSAEQLKSMGYTEAQIKDIMKLGNTANDAATKVKTFTQLFDTLQEAAQSGWTKSWEILIGDFGEAKELLTKMSDEMGALIGNSADARNKLLSGGLSSGWKQLLNEGIDDEQGYIDALEKAAGKNGKVFAKMVEDSDSFSDALKKGLKEGVITSDNFSDAVTNMADKMGKMSAKELETAGYTAENVKRIKELSAGLKDGSISMDEFVSKMERPSGRENLIEALWNSFDALMSIIKPIKEAFTDIFPPATGEQLYRITEAIRDFTAKLKLSDAESENLKSTFKGVFSILNIGVSIFKAVASGVAKMLGNVKGLDGGILGITGKIGESISKFSEAVTKADFFGKAIGKVADALSYAIGFLKLFISWINYKIEAASFDRLLKAITGVWNALKKIGNGISSTIGKAFDRLSKSADGASEASEKFSKSISKWTIIKKIVSWVSDLGNKVAEMASKLGKAFGNVFRSGDFATGLDIVNGGLFAAILVGVKKFVNDLGGNLDKIGGIFDGVKGTIDGAKGILDGVKDSLKAYQNDLKAKTLLKIAAAIAILAAAIVVIAMVDPEKLKVALGAITVLFADLMVSLAAFEKIVGNSNGATKGIAVMIGISAAVLILAIALKKISSLDWNGLAKGIAGIAGLVAILIATAKIMSTEDKTITKFAGQMIKLSIAVGMFALVAKYLSSMSWEELGKAGTGLLGITAILVAAAKIMDSESKAITKFGSQMIKISIAVGAMALVGKLLASMSWEELGKAGAGILGIVTILIATAKIMDGESKSITKFAGQMLIMSGAIAILAQVGKTLASMSWEELGKAGVGILGVVVMLVAAAKIMDGESKSITKFAGQMILMAAAVGIMALIAKKLSELSWEELIRGLTGMAVSLAILVGAFAVMNLLKGSVMQSAAAILVMSGSLLVLSGVMKALGSMTWGQIAKGLVAMALAFTIFGLAGLLLKPVVPTILALSAAIALFGIGCLAAGTGILALSVGLTGLSGSVAAAATAIVAAITIIVVGLLELIPSIVETLTHAIVAICEVITKSVPAIGAAIKAVVLTLLDVLVTCIPAIVEGAFKLLIGILDALITYLPTLAEKLLTLFKMVMGFLTSRAGEIVDIAFNFIIAVINGVAARVSELIEACVNLVGAIIQGIADALGPIIKNVIEPLFSLLKDLIIGVVEAIAPYIPVISAAIVAVTNIICNAVVKIVEAIAPFIPNIQKIVEAVSAAISKVCAAFISLVEQIAPIIESIATLVKELGTAISDTLNSVSEIVTSVFNGIADVITSVGDSIRTVLDGIANIIESIGNAALNAGTGFENLAKGVKTITNLNLIDMAASMAAVAAGIKKIASHSKGLADSGKGMQQIASGTKLSSDAFRTMAIGVTTVTSKLAAIKTVAASAMSGMVASVNASSHCFTKMSAIASKATQSIIVSFGSVSASSTSFKNTMASLASITASSMKTVATTIKGSGSQVVSSFKTMISLCLSLLQSQNGVFKKAGEAFITGLGSGISSKTPTIVKLFTSLIKHLIEMARKAQPEFTKYGKLLSLRFANGLKDGAASASTVFSSALSSAIANAKKYYKQFYDAGAYLAKGFANGITKNANASTAAATKMANNAAAATKKALNEHSPSKVFYKIGDYAGQGFTNALDDSADASYKSGFEMAKSATDGLGLALEGMSDTISNGMSDQPAIRPVLDLSTVRATDLQLGANVNASLTQPIESLSGIIANAQADINASNQEVVSAINSLREDLNKLYTDDEQEVALYIDSKKLASSIAKPMNRQLNILSRRGAY